MKIIKLLGKILLILFISGLGSLIGIAIISSANCIIDIISYNDYLYLSSDALKFLLGILVSVFFLIFYIRLFVYFFKRNNAKNQFIFSITNYMIINEPLVSAVEKSAKSLNFKILKNRILNQVLPQMKEGRSFYQSVSNLRQDPGYIYSALLAVINPILFIIIASFLYKNLFTDKELLAIKSGEELGILPETLSILKNRNLRTKSLVYGNSYSTFNFSMVVIVLTLLIFIFLSWFLVMYILPTYVHLFEGMHLKLFPTTIILITSIKLLQKWHIVLPLIIILMPLIILILIFKDNLKFNFPFISNIFRYKEYISFSESMSITLKKNKNLEEVIIFSGDLSGNRCFEKIIYDIGKKIKKGISLPDALREEKNIPPFFKTMVYFGQRTDELSKAFDEITAYYYEQLMIEMTKLKYKLSVTMTLIMGILCFFYYLAYFYLCIRLLVV